MTKLRHPNIVQFVGLCTLPPCILTGAEAALPVQTWCTCTLLVVPAAAALQTWSRMCLSSSTSLRPHPCLCQQSTAAKALCTVSWCKPTEPQPRRAWLTLLCSRAAQADTRGRDESAAGQSRPTLPPLCPAASDLLRTVTTEPSLAATLKWRLLVNMVRLKGSPASRCPQPHEAVLHCAAGVVWPAVRVTHLRWTLGAGAGGGPRHPVPAQPQPAHHPP